MVRLKGPAALLGLCWISFLLVLGCGAANNRLPVGKLSIGIVSYDEGDRSLEQYRRFQEYLADQTQTVIELEPVYNELRALEQIEEQNWSLVFASPGLAAIAIETAQYVPIMPLESSGQLRSVIVVSADSSIETLNNLQDKIVALGEVGSALGYYLPLYDMYGLTLEEIRFAPTPRLALEWLAAGDVDAVALSEQQFEEYKGISTTGFRVLHRSRVIPPGAILIGPTVDRNQEITIRQALADATADIAGDAGYLPTGAVPDYSQLIQFIEKVQPLESHVREQPAVLTLDTNTTASE